ncbi:MAG: hypothetical protein AAF651_12980, partial [Cyanobacteria bacterium P01_C01_bin.73]
NRRPTAIHLVTRSAATTAGDDAWYPGSGSVYRSDYGDAHARLKSPIADAKFSLLGTYQVV